MTNPFNEFTMVDTGEALFIDVTNINAFYTDTEENCTIILQYDEVVWAVTESVKEVYEAIDNFLNSDKLGF